MEITIRGDKLKITDSMKSYIDDKLGKLNKYLKNNDEIRANVIVKVKNHEQRVEITIPLKNYILRTEETQDDFYAAIDKAIDTLERQIKKNKTRIMSKTKSTIYDFDMSVVEENQPEEDDVESKVVKRKKVEVKPMNEEEAILQMELLDHDFFVFKNVDKECISVLYKRKDGNYGIIDTK